MATIATQTVLTTGKPQDPSITPEDIRIAHEKYGVTNLEVLTKDADGVLMYNGIMTLKRYAAYYGQQVE